MSNRKNWGEGFIRQQQAGFGGNRGGGGNHGGNRGGFGQQQGGNRQQGGGGRNDGRPQWGAGYQGRGGGAQGGGGNRFGALAGLREGAEQQTGGRGQGQGRFGGHQQDSRPPSGAGGRGQQQGRGQQTDWRRALEHDNANERPIWPLTCYSHLRSVPGQSGGGGPNDLEGDFSFEELRWAQVQAARAGASPQVLCQEMDAARHAQEQQLRAMSRGRQAPSLGGPPIPHLSTFLPPSHSLLTMGHGGRSQQPSPFGAPPATPFGQVVGAFGRNPSVAAQPSVFGAAPTAQPPAFGGGSAAQPSAFGGGFAAKPASGFGQQPGQGGATPFGTPQPAWPAQQSTPASGQGTTFGSAFGGQQPATPPTPAGQPGAAFGTPAASFGASPGGFGGGLTLPPTPAPTWNVAGQNPQASNPEAGAGGAAEMSAEDKAWAAPQFERGAIPDDPPPQIYCN